MSVFKRSSQKIITWQRRIQADLPAPEVPAIIKDEFGVEVPDGLIPRSAVDDDLAFIVAPWTPADDISTNYVYVGWRQEGSAFEKVNEYQFVPPIDDQPKVLHVPLERLEHGTYELSYKIMVMGNEVESLKKKVTVDRRAPDDGQAPAAPVFPTELAGVITDEYLIQYGQVEMTVPRYTDMRGKDTVFYYWTNKNPPPNNEIAVGKKEFTQDDIDNGDLTFVLPEDVIRSAGEGPRYTYYRLRDLAGNEGHLSTVSEIEVLLTPAPGNLRPPRIPLSARGLVDREHAREGAVDEGGVTVEIDQYDNPDSSQKVLINWDGTALAELDVNPAGFPLKAYVPWTTLVAKGLGPLDVQVDYQVRRGAYVTPPSQASTAPVNLTVAGQDHANAPALLNMTLAKLEVRGKNSDTPNKLTALDYGLDATATLTLFDNPQPLEKLEIFWGDIVQPVAEYEVKAGDTAGQPISVEIPWVAIELDLDNRTLPVYYTTSNGVNLQHARVTEVDVSIVLIEDLKAPTFPHATKFGYLNCCSVPRLWEGVTVHIEGSVHFAANDRIEMTWQGCDSLNGTNPIPGVTDTFTKTLNATEAANGFDIVVLPYESLIEPMIDNASATAQYELFKADGGYGRSEMDFVKIVRKLPSGQVCSPTNDLCDE